MSGGETTGVLKIRHNRKTPGAEEALKMLQELQREFAPLCRNRGWTVDERAICTAETAVAFKGGGSLLKQIAVMGDDAGD